MDVRTITTGNQVITTDGESKLTHDHYYYWDGEPSKEGGREFYKFYLERKGKEHIIFSGEPNDEE